MTPIRPSLDSKDPPGITRRTAIQGAGLLAITAALGIGTASPAAATPTDDFVALCLAQIGKPYKFATAGPSTFDCSGLIVWSLAQLGISAPRQSFELIAWATPIPLSQGRTTAGALLWRPGHIGVSLGNGQTVEAMNPEFDIRRGNANSPLWTQAGLVAQLGQSTPVPHPVSQEEETMKIVSRIGDEAAYLVSGTSMVQITFEQAQALGKINVPIFRLSPAEVLALMTAIHNAAVDEKVTQNSAGV